MSRDVHLLRSSMDKLIYIAKYICMQAITFVYTIGTVIGCTFF